MDKTKVFLLGTGRTFMNIFARLFLEFNVHYESPLQDGAKIFTPNHPTTSDPFLLSLVTQEPLIILVNQRVLQLPLVGSLIKHAGTIPVDKEGPRRAGLGGAQLPLLHAQVLFRWIKKVVMAKRPSAEQSTC